MNLPSLVQSFFESGEAALSSRDSKQLHALRITAKRLRYTLEILELEKTAPVLRKLRDLQKLLGNMNDTFVAERFLLAQAKLSPKAAPLPGRLHAAAEAHIEAFRGLWPRLFSKKVQTAWLTWARSLAK